MTYPRHITVLFLIAVFWLISCTATNPSFHQHGFTEPESTGYDRRDDVLGFYDTTADGDPRGIRKDVSGGLSGMVQFVQSHSVNPSGNEEHHMPRLAAEREALLLFTPDQGGETPDQLSVTVFVNGEEKSELEMRHPDKLFMADRPQQDARPDVVYSRRAWSVVLSWEWVRPGLSLEFSDQQGRNGILGADHIEMAPPSELVINNIRIGLLTDPPESEDHYMLLDPVRAGTDYFQTLPVSELVIAKYEDIRLDRVMVATGDIYDTASEDEGGVYSGDMRENTAKSTFSVGINLANWGIISSGMQSQHQPQLTQTVITHHAQGMYSNGEQLHGLSGGNGMLTLIRSVGNEFSHEIGHHFGLGHYPGRDGDNDFWTTHHHDSGWGYIGHRQRMRANLHWNRTELRDGSDGIPVYENLYDFTRDAMSGGDNTSSLSRYTHYTGYSTQTRIQPSLNRAVFAEDSHTGYRIWNDETARMEEYKPGVPDSEYIWFNSPDGYYLTPRRHGVEVFTLLGGYDPEEGIGLLYPPVRSNWGNVFDLPGPDPESDASQCWLTAEFSGGEVQKIAVGPQRMGSPANKLHVQLAADENPVRAGLYCQNSDLSEQLLSQVEFPERGKPMAPPVVIGRDAGYDALRTVELKKLEQAWLEAAEGVNPCDESHIQILCETYAEDANALTEPAQRRFNYHLENKEAGERIDRWVAAYYNELQKETKAASQALIGFLNEMGLGAGWKQVEPYLSPESKSILQSLEI